MIMDCTGEFPPSSNLKQRSNPRSSARLTASEATVVSLSTEENQISSPVVGNNSEHHDQCFSGLNCLQSEVKVSSISTNVSVLTHCTAASAPTSGNTATSHAPVRKVPNQPSTRRSKRLTLARIAHNKKQRTQLFAKPSATSNNDFTGLQKAINCDFSSSPSITDTIPASKRSNIFLCDDPENIIDMVAISQRIAILPAFPSLLQSNPDAHACTYLYKSVYGSEYHSSLLQRECQIYEKSKNRNFDNACAGRPRTRSICREEGKELSRILSSSAAPAYITSNYQRDITSNMRSILIDWIFEVSRELSLRHETIHSCVKILDRALEEIPVTIETFHTFGW